jgi:hypothetical protein
MGITSAICILFGLYFLYDWKIGYPNANLIAAKQEWFEKEYLPSYDQAKANGTLSAWEEQAKANGWPGARGDEPPKWVRYAAENGWPEKPKKFTQKEIDEQLWWGLGVIAIGLITALLMLLSRSKTLCADHHRLIMPNGQVIPFEHLFQIDKRKWESKGLAYLRYRQTPDSRPAKATLDALKFDEAGAEKIMQRLLASFKGELIEKIPDPEEDNSDSQDPQ